MITTPKIFKFGDCMLDCERFQLTRAGHHVKIERKPMELLILLVTRQGKLVTRDEIAASLWDPNVFVDVNLGINTLICKIRYALRDKVEQPRYVETIAGKGYCFVSEVIMKAPVDGFPVNGVSAATAAIEAPSRSFSEPPLASLRLYHPAATESGVLFGLGLLVVESWPLRQLQIIGFITAGIAWSIRS